MKTKRFTLIELVLVMAVVGIMIGISLPAFKNMILGSSFSQSANIISKTLYLSRTEAIAKRKLVAVVFPNFGAGCDELATVYVKYESGQFLFDQAIPNTKILQLSNTGVITAIEYWDKTAWKPTTTVVHNIPWTSYMKTYSTGEIAVILKPSMGLRSDENADMRITLSDASRNSAGIIAKTSRRIYFQISNYTGRVEITEGI